MLLIATTACVIAPAAGYTATIGVVLCISDAPPNAVSQWQTALEARANMLNSTDAELELVFRDVSR